MPHLLEISLLGELRLTREGRSLALPASRKTRALLAFLALTGRTHRRERLCEMFWELPDDPRGALRWALSKLRPLLNDPDCTRVVADRERVSVALDDVRLDYLDVRKRLESGEDPPLPDLQAMADALGSTLLDGLDLPQCEAFQSWLVAERDAAERLRVTALRLVVQHPDTSAAEALRWARSWARADPLSPEAAGTLASALRRSGRAEEAEDVVRAFRQTAREAGLDPAPDLVDVATSRTGAAAPEGPDHALRQTIGFCTAPDGVRIAYATIGEGPPLVKAANWLSHLELDWQSPIWGRTFEALSARHRFVRYDERGSGLSDWDVADISFDAFVRDLEAVTDALGLTRFPLLGLSQGCAVSVAYAVRHPERVSALVLIGGYAAGWRLGASAEERQRREAVLTLTRLGWGQFNPAYRHIFSQTFMPDGTADELAWFDEFQRQTASPENAARFQDAFGDIDVRDLLPQVRAPTLVLHAQGDQRIRLQQGGELAAGIPGARFVALDSRNHILLGREPAWATAMEAIDRFLAEHGC